MNAGRAAVAKPFGGSNTLYFGDNLDVLRCHVPDESVDLVYLDPPFNSNATYNVLFRGPTGEHSRAQIEAFEDTWHWNQAANIAFDEVMESGNTDAAEMLRAMRSFLKENDMMAYLCMMAVRLLELHRVLKPTGSIYLHCDPTTSHYLKLLLDAVFSVQTFTNEIIWRRTTPKGLAFSRYASNHDTILFYRKGAKATWSSQHIEYSNEYLERYNLIDERGRRFQATSLLNPNPNRPNLTYEFGGHKKVWRWTRDRMLRAEKEGRIYFPPGGGVPREKRFLEEQEGVPVSSVWTDIAAVNAVAQERLGYPTQKPVALLERIIAASSNEADLVLDPFCGCGTTVHAAQKLNRRWVGIDITHLAIGLVRRRLIDAFPHAHFDIVGVPKDVGGARALAAADKHQFQLWALSLVEAQPYRGGRKGGDGGVDGHLYFKPDGRSTEKAIVSVKGGQHLNPGMVRDLLGTVENERAKMGIFVTLEDPTVRMRQAASAAGLYKTEYGAFEKVQILTVEELLSGKKPHMPWIDPSVFRKARREKSETQGEMGF